ncbi:MAG: PAS domain-containing sensor histidine kinase [Candidatus Magasanikbacteria bacterium]
MEQTSDEQLLHTVYQFYRDIFDHAPIGIYTVDKNGDIDTFNPKMTELAGAENPEEVVGLNTLILPTYRVSGLDKLIRKGLKGRSFEKEIRYVSHTGKKESFRNYKGVPIFGQNGNVEHLLLLVEDITELRRKEELLIEYTKEIENIAKFPKESPSPTFRISTKGKLMFANRASADILKNFDIQTGNNVPDVLYTIVQKACSEKKCDPFEITVEGKTYSFMAAASPEDGYVSLYGRNITKEKEVERMKTEFVSLASHQLRTPLTGIKWFSELLLQKRAGKLTPNQKDFVSEIHQSNERMIKLVENMLNISRLEGGESHMIQKKSGNIIPTLKASVKEQESIAEHKRVQIKIFKTIPKTLNVSFDREKMKQVLDNLINNAVKYSKRGGKVIIGYKEKNDGIVISIKDNGIGIPKNDTENIFHQFFRSENAMQRKEKGAGLGLYMTKKIVLGHKGKIWFTSKKGSGTTFYLELPKKKKKN